MEVNSSMYISDKICELNKDIDKLMKHYTLNDIENNKYIENKIGMLLFRIQELKQKLNKYNNVNYK